VLPGHPTISTPARGIKNYRKPQARARVCIGAREAFEGPNTTVTSTLLVNHLYAHVLFDSGATNSFTTPKLVEKSCM